MANRAVGTIHGPTTCGGSPTAGCWIRKAVGERGLTAGLDCLADPIAEHEDASRRPALASAVGQPMASHPGRFRDEGHLLGPIEWTDEYPEEEDVRLYGEIGRRLGRELGRDGYGRILIDEAKANALFDGAMGRWRDAAPGRERFIADRRATTEARRPEREQHRRLEGEERCRRAARGQRDAGARFWCDPADRRATRLDSSYFSLKGDAALVGLARPCTEEQTREARRCLALELHPDHHGDGLAGALARQDAAHDRPIQAAESGRGA